MHTQQYLPVNWTDGMKINQSNFLAQDNANRYLSAQSAASLLHDNNYGLLPCLQQSSASVKLFLSTDNQQQLQLRIQQCRAVTRGGYYFEFKEDTALFGNNLATPLLNLSVPFHELKGKATYYYVVLSVQPFQRVPFGAADPAELPARFPYTKEAFALSLLPVQDSAINPIGLFQLPVGKIKIEEYKAVLEEEYIPPCTSVSSHYDLLEIHADMEQFYGKLENYSLQIIRKILQKNQNNEMAVIIQKLCDHITLFTASHLADIKMLGLYQPPVYIVSKISSLARLCKNTLDAYIGSGKEELINYCTEWCEMESCMTDVANHQYNHLELNNSFKKAMLFARMMITLFSNLAKLEYIGKRRDAGIFVKEKVVNFEPEVPVKTRKSFLAD